MGMKNKPQSWLVCQSPGEWHDWLKSHYDTESEVWLQIKKAGSIESGISLSEAVEEAICFGWIDSKMYSLDAAKYILHFTPRKPGSIWSLNNRIRAEALQSDGRMTEAGMAAVREAQANGRWQNAYSAKAQPDVPEDLRAALETDATASRNFENWPNSQKFQVVWWLEESRQPKTRASRIEKIVGWAHNKSKIF